MKVTPALLVIVASAIPGTSTTGTDSPSSIPRDTAASESTAGGMVRVTPPPVPNKGPAGTGAAIPNLFSLKKVPQAATVNTSTSGGTPRGGPPRPPPSVPDKLKALAGGTGSATPVQGKKPEPKEKDPNVPTDMSYSTVPPKYIDNRKNAVQIIAETAQTARGEIAKRDNLWSAE